MPSELLTTLLTTDDRELLRNELGRLKSAVFKLKKGNLTDVLKSQVRVDVARVIESELRDQKKDPEHYFEEILAQLDTLPILQLTIAFEPTQLSLEHWSSQAAEALGEGVVLQITVQPEMIGGAIIVWKGRYVDVSLKKKFAAAVSKAIGKIETTSAT